MQLITGNTYPVKEEIKALGGRWNKPRQGWEVPDPAAARLIASAPEMLAALHNIYANAGESPEWIRMTIDAALKKATTQSTNNDHETN